MDDFIVEDDSEGEAVLAGIQNQFRVYNQDLSDQDSNSSRNMEAGFDSIE